jgi:hypothetical protein
VESTTSTPPPSAQMNAGAVASTANIGPMHSRVLTSNWLVVALVGIGALLRIAQYLSNRSLWIDEAWLALNIIERPLSGVVTPLDFNQAAPVGFLLVEGIAAKTLGFSEYALRFFPLLCGLVSIPAFVWLARRLLSANAVPLAVGLFVVADALIYYSSEVKPYQTDVAAAVGLLAGGTLLVEDSPGPTRKTAVAIAAAGLGLIALSFPAVLVAASLAATFAVRIALNWRQRLRSAASLAVLCWGLASVGAAVFGATRSAGVRESFEGASGRFLGMIGPSSPLHAVNAIGTNIAGAIGFLQNPPYSQVMKLALLCATVGALALLRRSPTHLAMLVVPFVLLFVASAAHAYPILERTELFLIPAVVLLIAEGIAQLVRWAPRRGKIVTAILLAVAVGGGPVWLAGKGLVRPRTHEEMRPVLEFVRDHWQPGDTLYVHYGAQYALLYYDECRCLRLSRSRSRHDLWPLKPTPTRIGQYAEAAMPLTSDVVLGRYFGIAERPYIEDLGRVPTHGRVWFLYSHLSYEGERALIETKMLRRLGRIGKRISGIDEAGAHAYLYQLRPEAIVVPPP